MLALVCSIKFTKQFNIDFLNKKNTTIVNGFFLLLVFLSHISGYYKFNSNFDYHYNLIRSVMGQTVVVTFLFFSGYGVMESICNKPMYMHTFLKNRPLKLLVHFDIAVTIFLIINWFIGRNIVLKQYILALTTWGGIGNSNWYITCIICCYIFSFICYHSAKGNVKGPAFYILLISLCLNYMFLLSKYRSYYWYDTILCYPLGVLFSIYKENIKEFFKSDKHYLLVCGGVIMICVISFMYSKRFIPRVVFELSFCLSIVFLMMHMKFKSSFFEYIGENLFGLYILQRVPMMFFKATGAFDNKYIYVVTCFLVTLLINELFKKLLKLIKFE